MPVNQNNLNLDAIRETILKWLKKRLRAEDHQQLNSAYENLKNDAEDWEVFSSFSRVSRYTGKDPLEMTPDETAEAETLRTGWKPVHWTTDQLGRTLLLLGLAERDKQEFLDKLDKLFVSSDLGEGVALYQSLPVLPYPTELRERAAEGIRTNITDIFNAVALRNPYPAAYFDDDAWNQVILKSLFVGSPLYLIQGVDERANEPLARMLVEYAHERWSAGREVSPELWRPVGPFIDKDFTDDIERVLNHPDPLHQHAAILALKSSLSDAAVKLLKEYKSTKKDVEESITTWQTIGEKVHEAKG